ncbi:MAG: hypothetical protein JNK15_21190 [Planctomycetes bacterium]|nr:hypothetical protein [Planctomycetota bacterium]
MIANDGVTQSAGFAPWRSMVVETDVTGWSSGRLTVTDDVRGRIVSFGCHPPDSVHADTWEWCGTDWLPFDAARLPPFRRNGAIAYDSQRQRVVMFGGAWQSNLADTWEWNGDAWTLRNLPVAPPARSGCTAAFDAARGRVVLFGGQVFGDTWEYDGLTWTQRFPTNAPSARRDHLMAYDEARQRIVLHGGQAFAPYALSNETWEWDGSNWSLQSAGGPVTTRQAMVFDRARQCCVMFGGYPQFDATLEWNGTTWSVAAAAAPWPWNSFAPLMARDPATGSAVVFTNGQKWQWTGSGWNLQSSTTLPTDSETTVACTDTIRNRVVACTSTGGTFEWDGTAWTRSAASLGLRYMPMVFDAARGVSVQFGGMANGNSGVNDQTRVWNGTSWTTVPAPSRPPARYHAELAYDAARQRVVLFGGIGPFPPNPGPPPVYGDTWTFDGVTWTQHFGVGPSARFDHVMAYDPIRQVVVLHGGGSFGTGSNETWEWNGSAWTQRSPAIAPPIRGGAAFAFDPNRGALVLSGGTWTGPATDTWLWDGVNWTQLAMQPAVWPRNDGAFTLDPTRNELMLLGGSVVSGSTVLARRDAQWLRLSVTPPQTTTIGASCAAGTPPRLSAPVPFVGNADFAVDVLDANAQSLCCVGFATSVLAQPVGPCTLHLGTPTVLVAGVTDVHGFARFALPLPPTAGLVGAQIVAQGVAWSGFGPLSGFDLTAARTMLLGD